jgi:hypothetical protein
LVSKLGLLGAGSRLRAAAGALFPPKGEEKKSEGEAEDHLRGSVAAARAVRVSAAMLAG